MLSNVDIEMLCEHVDAKRNRCTQDTKKLLRNAVKYAHGLGATPGEIVRVLPTCGLHATSEEVDTILEDIRRESDSR